MAIKYVSRNHMFTLDAETAAALLSGNFTIALGIPPSLSHEL